MVSILSTAVLLGLWIVAGIAMGSTLIHDK